MAPVQETYRVRPAAVAGVFYSRGAEELGGLVTALLDGASAEPRRAVRGVIAPHAGYVFSGPVAAEAFAVLRSSVSRFRRAAVIGPSHFVRFEGLAAPSHTGFATPLGVVPVDREVVDSLASDGLAVIDDAPHARDHALEVELPFLQMIFGTLPIVPLLFGNVPATVVADAIAQVWTQETLLVVSSDLSHFEPYDAACRHDRRTARAIEGFAEATIGPSDACGHLAIRGALIEAERRGLGIDRLDLRNSGDTAGDRSSVVGYGAWALSA